MEGKGSALVESEGQAGATEAAGATGNAHGAITPEQQSVMSKADFWKFAGAYLHLGGVLLHRKVLSLENIAHELVHKVQQLECKQVALIKENVKLEEQFQSLQTELSKNVKTVENSAENMKGMQQEQWLWKKHHEEGKVSFREGMERQKREGDLTDAVEKVIK